MARQLRAQYPAMIDASVNAGSDCESPRYGPGPLAAWLGVGTASYVNNRRYRWRKGMLR
ncbi:MAG: hypothetical protein BWX84_01971 [Verrucomicrobia bacterium ADurb.Bin118]|nr:MAG: hypothetical protein BWX84_01971 [Verrucomicrobia bacterium ADurb.Bin118]